jgi:hypothetical protein
MFSKADLLLVLGMLMDQLSLAVYAHGDRVVVKHEKETATKKAKALAKVLYDALYYEALEGYGAQALSPRIFGAYRNFQRAIPPMEEPITEDTVKACVEFVKIVEAS